jgi:hypothetical protein
LKERSTIRKKDAFSTSKDGPVRATLVGSWSKMKMEIAVTYPSRRQRRCLTQSTTRQRSPNFTTTRNTPPPRTKFTSKISSISKNWEKDSSDKCS